MMTTKDSTAESVARGGIAETPVWTTTKEYNAMDVMRASKPLMAHIVLVRLGIAEIYRDA